MLNKKKIIDKKIKVKFVTGERVMVIAGDDKKKIGNVIEVSKDKKFIKIENINLKTHFDKNDGVNTGGLNEKEGWISVSNVLHVTSDDKPTKIKRVRENGKLLIFSKKTNEQLRTNIKKDTKVKLEDIDERKQKEEFKKEQFEKEQKKKKDDTNIHKNKKGSK